MQGRGPRPNPGPAPAAAQGKNRGEFPTLEFFFPSPFKRFIFLNFFFYYLNPFSEGFFPPPAGPGAFLQPRPLRGKRESKNNRLLNAEPWRTRPCKVTLESHLAGNPPWEKGRGWERTSAAPWAPKRADGSAGSAAQPRPLSTDPTAPGPWSPARPSRMARRPRRNRNKNNPAKTNPPAFGCEQLGQTGPRASEGNRETAVMGSGR